jgi:hypothetical protein
MSMPQPMRRPGIWREPITLPLWLPSYSGARSAVSSATSSKLRISAARRSMAALSKHGEQPGAHRVSKRYTASVARSEGSTPTGSPSANSARCVIVSPSLAARISKSFGVHRWMLGVSYHW